jgi:hypothetical protein
MKTMMCAAAAMLLMYGAAFAQSSTVTIQNQELSMFYYLVDPAELAGLTAGSPLLSSKVSDFFASPAAQPAFTLLAPEAEAKLEGLADGQHLLLGFFAVEQADEFPVRVVTITADSRVGERFYALFADPPQMNIARGTGRLAGFARPDAAASAAAVQTAAVQATSDAAAQTAAEQAASQASTPTTATQAGADAAAVQTAAAQTAAVQATSDTAAPSAAARASLAQIAAFSRDYSPVVFTREQGGSFSVLPIGQSRSWQQSGTRIGSISAAMDSVGLRVSLAVPGGISEKVSYFFYVFSERSLGKENGLTFELEPRANGNRGACLLWEKGAPSPRLVGTVSTTSSEIGLDIPAFELPQALAGAAAGETTIDLTSGWYDKSIGAWEEFYFATLSAGQIPVTR